MLHGTSTSRESLIALETGVRIQLPINKHLLVGVGVQVYWKVPATRYSVNPREVYSVGVSYFRR